MHAIKTPLNPQTVGRIQSWLKTSESIECRKLISTLITIEEVEAVDLLHKSEGEDDRNREDALAKFEMAKQYKLMLHVMDSIAFGHTPGKPAEKFPYVTVALEQDTVTKSVEELLNKPD